MRFLVLIVCVVIIGLLLGAVILNALDGITNTAAHVEHERTAQVQAVQENRTERFEAFLVTVAAVTTADNVSLLIAFVLSGGLFFVIWRDTRHGGGGA